MIKINLMLSKSQLAAAGAGEAPAEGFQFASEEDIRKQGILRLLVILLFPLVLYIYETQSLPTKTQELAGQVALLAALTATNQKAVGAVSEIKKFQIDKARIESQIGALENLKKGRMQEVKVLDSIQRNIPGKVWLSKVEINSGKVNLQGLSGTDQGLTTFMDSLSRSIFLREVSLVKSEQVEDPNGGTLKKFEINCFLETAQ